LNTFGVELGTFFELADDALGGLKSKRSKTTLPSGRLGVDLGDVGEGGVFTETTKQSDGFFLGE
jgi:hypothetical protein